MKNASQIEFDRGLPAAVDLERYLLALLMMAPTQLTALDVQADWFSLEAHRRIFAAMLELGAEGMAADKVMVIQRLMDRGRLESVGGFTYFTTLDDGLPQAHNAEAYCRGLRDASARRGAIQALERARLRLFADTQTAEDALLEVRQALDGAEAGLKRNQTLESVGEIITRYGGMQAFLSPDSQNAACVALPWTGLTEVIYALRESELTIVAARPGIGKTAFAAQLAMAAAAQGKAAACFSLEMDSREYLSRMIATEAQVNLHKHRKYGSSPEHSSRMARTAGELNSIPLYTDARTGSSVAAVYAAVQRLQAREKVGLVIVDYLQLIASEQSRGSRSEAVAAVTRDLKLMASGLSVHVVALSQLTREADKFWADGREPENWMLLDSGGIEAAANNIIFLWPSRDDFRACKAGDAHEMLVEVWVTKQRSGPTGKVKLKFTPRYTRFDDYEVLV